MTFGISSTRSCFSLHRCSKTGGAPGVDLQKKGKRHGKEGSCVMSPSRNLTHPQEGINNYKFISKAKPFDNHTGELDVLIQYIYTHTHTRMGYSLNTWRAVLKALQATPKPHRSRVQSHTALPIHRHGVTTIGYADPPITSPHQRLWVGQQALCY